METGNIKLDLDTEVRTLNFEELNLNQSTLDELTKADLKEATPLQQSIISNTVNKQNLVIKAETDANKHTAIAVAALEAFEQSEKGEGTTALVITHSSGNARSISDKFH